MRNLLIVIAVFVFASVSLASPVPTGAELDKYPVTVGPLTTAQMADMGLRPIRLTESTDFLGFNRTRGIFELVTVVAGDLVLVDADGVIRYKAACGNRLVAFPVPPAPKPTVVPCPACPQCPSPCVTCPPACPPATQGFWSGLGFWGWLGMGLLGLVLGLLALGLALALLAGMIDRLLDSHEARRGRRPVPPAPPAPPAPAAGTRYWAFCHGCGRHHYFVA
ncbi:MAG: hypothetical protein WCT44_02585 [Candidatus Paceibacterota bacterium]